MWRLKKGQLLRIYGSAMFGNDCSKCWWSSKSAFGVGGTLVEVRLVACFSSGATRLSQGILSCRQTGGRTKCLTRQKHERRKAREYYNTFNKKTIQAILVEIRLSFFIFIFSLPSNTRQKPSTKIQKLHLKPQKKVPIANPTSPR